MSIEETFVMIKPDAVQRNLIPEILARFTARGLQIVYLEMRWANWDEMAPMYSDKRGFPFYNRIMCFMTSGPVVLIVLRARNAVQVVRDMIGATVPSEAARGTIRGDFGIEVERNIIHASDSLESAAFEIRHWTRDGPIHWEPCQEQWLRHHPQ